MIGGTQTPVCESRVLLFRDAAYVQRSDKGTEVEETP
jgi:hypothetical protein